MLTVTLYTRPGCHLCHEARALLQRAGRGLPVTVSEVDIDADPTLRERFDVRIPVVAAAGQELDWPFTDAQVRRLLVQQTSR